MKAPPPQLLFDDGSRAMQESHIQPDNEQLRRAMPLEFYEVERLAGEISILHGKAEDTWSHRVALQFPDELLNDAPAVCSEFERLLPDALIFCLGDTTYASCCPDQVAAAHLDATCLVHYGHACLSPSSSVPVLYSFGHYEIDRATCVERIATQAQETGVSKVLLLYEISFSHAIEKIEKGLTDKGLTLEIGRVPKGGDGVELRGECCGESNDNQAVHCCQSNRSSVIERHREEDMHSVTSHSESKFAVGGLVFPREQNWSDHALVFIGDDTTRQYLNIILHFLSMEQSPPQFWTFNPLSSQLSSDISPRFQRILNRRFYLVQKARQANVFGILVANLSDGRIRNIVKSLRKLVEDNNLSSYTLVVGKINPAKLANFAEIDCFVLVACPEHSLLEDDRDFHTPVITPMELSMALGDATWGECRYSLNVHDYLQTAQADKKGTDMNDDDTDAPYFSLVTGRYEAGPTNAEENDLLKAPGQGQLMEYKSAASDFLRSREYRGLQVEDGADAAPAIPGQQGIASNYGDR